MAAHGAAAPAHAGTARACCQAPHVGASLVPAVHHQAFVPLQPNHLHHANEVSSRVSGIHADHLTGRAPTPVLIIIKAAYQPALVLQASYLHRGKLDAGHA